jgi:hypothetical protein
VKTRTTSFLLLACIGCASKPAPPAPPAQTFASCVLLIQVNDYKAVASDAYCMGVAIGLSQVELAEYPSLLRVK